MATPKQTDPQFKLRMPGRLKGQIEEAAAQNNRSLNAEIVARLEETFDGNQGLWDSVNRIEEAVTEMQKQMAQIAKRVEGFMSRPYDDPNEWRD